MYHFQINGIDVTCETAAELYAITNFHLEPLKSCVGEATNFEPLHAAIDEHHEQNGNGRRVRNDVAEAWAKARRVHKQRGLTVREAFSQIIAKK